MEGLKRKAFQARILVWVLLIPLTLAAMAAPLWVAALYALAWIVAASLEFIRLYARPFRTVYILYLIAPILVWFATLSIFDFPLVGYLVVAIILEALIWIIISPGNPEQLIPMIVLPLYLGFIPGHFVLLKQETINQNLSYAWLVFPFIMIWINDTLAYFIGSLIGRTPLCPRISPKKTVEGLIAGILVTVGIGVGFWILFMSSQSWWQGALLALAVAVAGVLGDLLESALKRERGVKNTSEILGGHGGFLDRIDSLIFGVAVYYYLYALLRGL